MLKASRLREYLDQLPDDAELVPAKTGQMSVYENTPDRRRHAGNIYYGNNPRLTLWEGSRPSHCATGLLTTICKRPELTARFLDYYREFDFKERVCVTSPEDETADFHDYTGWHRVEHKNDPLSEKWNKGMMKFRNLKVDGVMIVGSDDFINAAYLERVLSMNSDAAEVDGIYFLNESTGEVIFLAEATVGAGRYLSRKALERVKFRAWPEGKNKVIDHAQMLHLRDRGIEFDLVTTDVREDFAVMDVKTETNIWAFDHIKEKGAKVEVVPRSRIDKLFEGWE